MEEELEEGSMVEFVVKWREMVERWVAKGRGSFELAGLVLRKQGRRRRRIK